jgi:hypothetical protein
MTADFYQFSHDILGRTATRIFNEVRGINRVVYDITSKPCNLLKPSKNGAPDRIRTCDPCLRRAKWRVITFCF